MHHHPPSKVFFLSVLLLGWVFSISQSFLVLSQQPPAIQRLVSIDASPTEDDSVSPTPQEVSDAEALLACYAFLKRHKRVDGNWTQMERRQRMKAVAQPHYFWEEDVSKIATRLQRDLQGETTTTTTSTTIGSRSGRGTRMNREEDDEDLFEGDGGETRMRPPRLNSAAEVWSGEFTSFPTDPSPTRMRRSLAAKQTWSDPTFREQWYQRRWSNKVKNKDPETLEDMALELQMKALPTGFLGSPELCSMTEEEISLAIQTYLTKTQKQITARKQTLHSRKELLQKQMDPLLSGNSTTSGDRAPDARLSRDSLFSPDETSLQEIQRKRSQRAKQIYQKRLENKNDPPKLQQQQPPLHGSLPKRPLPQGRTPQDAMVRILHHLQVGTLPSVEDVEIIMKPGKLGKRRNVLRKILWDHFRLRGKCVPSSDGGDLGFVTTCAIDDLGALVMALIRKTERKRSSLTKTNRIDKPASDNDSKYAI